MPWPVAEAKARLSALLDAAVNEGLQTVSRRGVETAVLGPIAEWKRLRAADPRFLGDPLTDPNGPHDFDIPRLGNFRLRPASLENSIECIFLTRTSSPNCARQSRMRRSLHSSAQSAGIEKFEKPFSLE